MIDFNDLFNERFQTGKRFAVMGIGAMLMGDDGAGVILAQKLKKKMKQYPDIPVEVFIGHSAPENFTGAIKQFKPDQVIIIDAADLKEEPGSIMVIDKDIINGVSFSTHTLPMKIIVEYLEKEINCQTTIIGIQPELIEYGKKLSPKIKKAVNETVISFEKAFLTLIK